ncbi:cytochrome c oxidase assembly protein [Chelativorans sp. Marseille-P2723]|uniref:cytochrome c oxidase assembly protein n=1 Tax=Chelativorans sp. Marseille-P2723 TaxID=2709133 RepID=UPI00156E08A3|nr:cytochrome c oxidase assembly protein [Chelativorans sp. Marseille-P2723]
MEALQGTYCGPPPAPSELWMAWNLDPFLLLALGIFALTVSRTKPGALAVATLVIVFVSPLCALSAALFSARVVHHVLLVAAAGPLIALAWPAREVRSIAIPFIVSTSVLWLWHLPQAYDLALSNIAVYWVMQATLLVTAVAFWRAVFDRRQGSGRALLFILAGFMQMALLGALLTLAPEPLYAIHAIAPWAWGFTPLADQQLGGLIMWVPAGLPFALWSILLARREWQSMAQGAA